MNIWMLNHYAVTPNLSAGTRHYDFGKELSRRGHNVKVFASGFHPARGVKIDPESNHDYLVETIDDSFDFIWIKTKAYKTNNWRRAANMLSYSMNVPRVAKSLNLEKPDVIIGSSVHLFAVLTGYLLSKKLGSQFIMEVRDLWPESLIDMGVSKWHPFIMLLSFLEKFLYKRAGQIIVLPPKANEYIEALGVDSQKIHWIPNGVDLSKFDIGDVDKSSKNNKDFVVMYLGALGTANNLYVALDSASILKDKCSDIKFVFIGDGPEKSGLLQKAKALKLHNVEFMGSVEKKEVPELIKKADVLYFNLPDLPVFKYGISPNKLFDYLASGKPIIFSCTSANNPVDEAGAGITISPGDPEALADALLKLYDTPDTEKEKMGSNGREYVRKYHDIPILVDRLECLFNIEEEKA